jgi:hypothetical protein
MTIEDAKRNEIIKQKMKRHSQKIRDAEKYLLNIFS